MVRITTVWDTIDGVNQKVFQIRGDEAYARTTDVKFSINNNYSSATDGYTLTAVVDVLRDTDNSTLTFYDGDEVILVYDWLSSYTNKSITLPKLSWDVEHLIKVVYDGNSKCLKSQSQTISVQKTNPDLTGTTITNRTTSDNYPSNTSIILRGRLNKDSGSASLSGRELTFYCDDVVLDTVATNTNGDASYTIPSNTLSNGIHEIDIVFDGDNPLGASKTSFNLSIGYVMTLVSYPATFVNGVNNTVKVKIEDNLGNPIPEKSISCKGQSATSDSDGIATITGITSVTDNSQLYATHNGYTSNVITAYSCTLSGIEMSYEDGITVNGKKEPITITVQGTGTLSNIPVTLMGAINGTYYTGRNGTVNVDYVGGGLGTVTIIGATPSYEYSTSITIDDLLYYSKSRKFSNVVAYYTNIIPSEQSSYILTPYNARLSGQVTFDISSRYWKAEFTLVNFSGKYRGGITINGARLDSSYNLGDIITVINDSDGLRVMRNGEVVLSDVSSIRDLIFVINDNTNSATCRMFYDDLKIWRLWE
ncbi:MAG: hypothetical protein J6Y78_04385 [Paludibacteraceae bacterium]|nr:hypothetical protein [Paludibacteraceae bacterium]